MGSYVLIGCRAKQQRENSWSQLCPQRMDFGCHSFLLAHSSTYLPSQQFLFQSLSWKAIIDSLLDIFASKLEGEKAGMKLCLRGCIVADSLVVSPSSTGSMYGCDNVLNIFTSMALFLYNGQVQGLGSASSPAQQIPPHHSVKEQRQSSGFMLCWAQGAKRLHLVQSCIAQGSPSCGLSSRACCESHTI